VTTVVRGWIRAAGLFSAIAGAVVSATCNYGEVTVVEPAAKGPSDTLSLTILPGEAQAAAALGWKAGIPGAEVIIAPSVKPNPDGPGDTATGPPIATLVADSAGHISVPELPAGWYYVEVRRWLSDSERARLAPGEDLVGFMTQVAVQRGSDTVYVPGSHRHSLILSEVSEEVEYVPGAGCCYGYGGYLELANNADTTVYLDGLVLALFQADGESNSGDRCAREAPFDNDPNGVWVYYADSLPGSGREYPLAPGAVAVIATDAIDHRANSPQDGLDLSHANFEMTGDADVDNPSVPNSIVLGFNDRANGGGHGLVFSMGTSWGIVVALPVDTASLPTRQYDIVGLTQRRIPADRILDVFLTFYAPMVTADVLCPRVVNSRFDSHPAPLVLRYPPGVTWRVAGQYSVQRKVAYTRPDGRKVLQDTRSTEADYFQAQRTPFSLP